MYIDKKSFYKILVIQLVISVICEIDKPFISFYFLFIKKNCINGLYKNMCSFVMLYMVNYLAFYGD